jgi:hypothetical protein
MEPEGNWYQGFLQYFVPWLIFYGEESLVPHPTPKLEDHRLSAVCDWLFNILAATLHIWRLFLHPQPEDIPCRGDKDPLIMVSSYYTNKHTVFQIVGIYCPLNNFYCTNFTYVIMSDS